MFRGGEGETRLFEVRWKQRDRKMIEAWQVKQNGGSKIIIFASIPKPAFGLVGPADWLVRSSG